MPEYSYLAVGTALLGSLVNHFSNFDSKARYLSRELSGQCTCMVIAAEIFFGNVTVNIA